MNYYTFVIIMILLALGVLTILISENNRISQQKKQLFMATNLLIALSALAECAGVHISGNANVPKGVLAAVKAVDYTLTPMTGGALIALMQKPNTKNRVLRGIFIANVILQVVSAFRGWMVVIDDQNHYTHGPLYPVYMVLYLAVVIIIADEFVVFANLTREQTEQCMNRKKHIMKLRGVIVAVTAYHKDNAQKGMQENGEAGYVEHERERSDAGADW